VTAPITPGHAVVRGVRAIAREANPVRFFRALWARRDLIRQLTQREITGRYRSSALGVLWSFVTPLVTLLLYTFVFGVVFKARWPGGRTDNLSEYGLLLFAGITAFSIFSECATRAPGLIAGSPNYVKKVVFPLEILPVTIVGAALFHAGISVALLVVGSWLFLGTVSATLWLLPVVLLPVTCLSLGLGWILASLGTYLRDIGHTVGLITQVLFFTTPIFYAMDAVPPSFRPFIALNPLTPAVENMRRVSVMGLWPDWSAFWVSLGVGLLVLCLGHAWFSVTKRGFSDVI
jgi:lipopolysaccharide transport system permease protein